MSWTRLLVRARQPPGVDEGTPVPASHLETPAPVLPGAGVGVSSRAWLREKALDAQERSATQWLPPEGALWSRVIPWLSSEAWSSLAPLPSP